MPQEIRDVAPGLWVWRVDYPDWHPGAGWPRTVTSTCIVAEGEVAVIDPIRPAADASEVWDRLDSRPPTIAVVLKPDHVRDVDLFVQRYGARALGPRLFSRDDNPETELEPIESGARLPGWLVALYDGRGCEETPLWLPDGSGQCNPVQPRCRRTEFEACPRFAAHSVRLGPSAGRYASRLRSASRCPG